MAWRQRIEARLTRAWWRPGPSPLAILLWPASTVYRAVVALRRIVYRLGWLASGEAPVPVIVVGNMVVGGAGKTPTVIAIVQALHDAGLHPGVVARGYGREARNAAEVSDASSASEVGDEPLLIRRRSGVPVWVAPRRIDAARALCAAHPEVDVIVADDGLQHLALRRDVQVVVFDERGTGNGRLLPAGPLREPMPRYVPVNTLVLYNAAAASTPWPGAMATRALSGAVLLEEWRSGRHATRDALLALRCRPLLTVAGTAEPQRFFAMLAAEGLAFDTLPLPDHHGFAQRPWPAATPDVVVTEKDAVKLPARFAEATRIWVVPLDFGLPEDFIAELLQILQRVTRR